MRGWLDNWIEMGSLRIALHVTAFIYILLTPFSTPKRVLETTSELFWGGVLPATTPLVIVVLLFDLLMCIALRGDSEPERREILGRAAVIHVCLVAVLITLFLNSLSGVLF
ncbi:MAG: hypothetical protein VX745_04625 [Pseudomonadota bacterium]|nr:hypothetical protein [Pseudomonadota bacterium]